MAKWLNHLLPHLIMNNKLIAIVGPTAAGKTSLAVKLAQKFNGEIVSADSRQVYRGMDIGTGKDLEEYGRVPYHLIDVADPQAQFTLADFQKLAYRAIQDITNRQKLPILTGGSGLYVQAVVDGYLLDDVQPDEKLRFKLEKKSLKRLQRLVKKYKITLNQSDFNNPRRLIRAIEKARAKKQNGLLAKKPVNSKNDQPKFNCLILGLNPPQKILHRQIDQRLKSRLEKQGMVEEVKLLIRQGVTWERLDDFGLEYRFIGKYLKGELNYEVMVRQLSLASRQFAKRQLTWFKKDARIHWLDNQTEAEHLITNFIK